MAHNRPFCPSGVARRVRVDTSDNAPHDLRCYLPPMFAFGDAQASASPKFVPEEESQGWIQTALARVRDRLGPPARESKLITSPSILDAPRNLDSLFDLICDLQAQVGQEELEFTLLAHDQQANVDPSFEPLGDPTGQLMHSFFSRSEETYLTLFSDAAFRVLPVLYASVARELGRFALHRSGGALFTTDDEFEHDPESESELAAISLGLGIWIANGAVMFENGCCGGGCGVDLRSLRAGLSVPEVGHALAVDARARGLGKWSISRHLESTQKAAFKKNWSAIKRAPAPAALASASSRGALGS